MAQSWSDIVRGIPSCRLCNLNERRTALWKDNTYAIYLVRKSAWLGHLCIASLDHVPASTFFLPECHSVEKNNRLARLYQEVIPTVWATVKIVMRAASYDLVQVGHVQHFALQFLPRLKDGQEILLFGYTYKDPQPGKALNLSIPVEHPLTPHQLLQMEDYFRATLQHLFYNPPLPAIPALLPAPVPNLQVTIPPQPMGSEIVLVSSEPPSPAAIPGQQTTVVETGQQQQVAVQTGQQLSAAVPLEQPAQGQQGCVIM